MSLSPQSRPLSTFNVDSSNKPVPPPLIKSSPSLFGFSGFSLGMKRNTSSSSSLNSLGNTSQSNGHSNTSSPSHSSSSLSSSLTLSSSSSMTRSPSREKLLQVYEKHRLKKAYSASKVLSFMFIGDRESTLLPEVLKKEHITHIVVLSSSFKAPEQSTGIECKHIPISDYGDDDLETTFLEEVKPFIEEAKTSNGNVLVSCRMGINRSASIVLAWLMIEEQLSLQDAYTFLLNRHPQIKPHQKYVEQLGQMEMKHFGIEKPTLFPEDIQGSSCQHAHILSALLPSEKGTEIPS